MEKNGKRFNGNNERIYPNIVSMTEHQNGTHHLLTQLFFSNGEEPIVRVSTNIEENRLEDHLRFLQYVNEQILKHTT